MKHSPFKEEIVIHCRGSKVAGLQNSAATLRERYDELDIPVFDISLALETEQRAE